MRAPTLLLVLLAASPAWADADPWLSRDKALHFGVELGATTATYQLGASMLQRPPERAAFAASLALAAGGAKELYDLRGHGDPSWKDFTWDAVGVLVGIGLSLAIDATFRQHPSWL